MSKVEFKVSCPAIDKIRVVLYPFPTLMEEAQAIVDFDESLRLRSERLAYVLKSMPNGIGLAANQVGWNQRVFAVYTNLNEKGADREIRIYVNPEILESQGDETDTEGCLSFPGIQGKVARLGHIKVSAYDIDGNRFEEEYDGLQARCFQHELDHLNGINFIDHLDEVDSLRVSTVLKRMKKR